MSHNARREPAANHPEVRFRRDPFLGTSESIQRLKSMAQSILGTSLPILIQGETGTGKGVLADWLTQHGPRSGEPFFDLNCAGLSRELWESELFGHKHESTNKYITKRIAAIFLASGGCVLPFFSPIDPLLPMPLVASSFTSFDSCILGIFLVKAAAAVLSSAFLFLSILPGKQIFPLNHVLYTYWSGSKLIIGGSAGRTGPIGH